MLRVCLSPTKMKPYSHPFLPTHIHVHMYICTCTYIRVHMYMYVYTYVRVHRYIVRVCMSISKDTLDAVYSCIYM